ncbi:MAG: hypothetical protein ACOCUA_03195, partial [archaeon]
DQDSESATLDGPQSDMNPTITVEDRSQTRDIDATDVVDAIAGAPSKHRAKAKLGLSMTGFERLLEELDLTAIFEAEAPLATDYVHETVAAYLEADV